MNNYFDITIGEKQYELSNHLGNVLTVVSDKKIPMCDKDLKSNLTFSGGSLENFTTGWSGQGSGYSGVSGSFPYTTISNVNNSLKTNATAIFGGNRLVFNTIVGKTYFITFDFNKGTTTGIYAHARALNIISGNANSPYTGTEIKYTYYNTTGTYTFGFEAITAQTQLLFEKADNGSNYFYIDNVKIEEDNSIFKNFVADVLSASDYSPFGAPLAGRTFTANTNYRFHFNGQEADGEIAGMGNIMSAEFWEYDTRLGRRWDCDPVTDFDVSPYATIANNPLVYTDPTGLKPKSNIGKFFYNSWQSIKQGLYVVIHSITGKVIPALHGKTKLEYRSWGGIQLKEVVITAKRKLVDFVEGINGSWGASIPTGIGNIPPWVKTAYSQLGIKETTNNNDGQEVESYLKSAGLDTGNPWCGAFVNWCFKENDIDGINEPGRALNWSNFGVGLNNPAYGSIATMKRKGGGHVGFIVGLTNNGRVVLLGGNQGDKVQFMAVKKSKILHFRYPTGYEPSYTLPEIDVKGSNTKLN